jgi:hypothetical protein
MSWRGCRPETGLGIDRDVVLGVGSQPPRPRPRRANGDSDRQSGSTDGEPQRLGLLFRRRIRGSVAKLAA